MRPVISVNISCAIYASGNPSKHLKSVTPPPPVYTE